jgi:hypothetical protein
MDNDISAKYEKNGIVILFNFNRDEVIFKKNGLTISIPFETFKDFAKEMENAVTELDKEVNEMLYDKILKRKHL